MELQDFFPKKPEFLISSTGRLYSFRIPNLEDRARFREMLGGSDERIGLVFKNLEWDVIAKLAYRLLEQKEEFPARVVRELNDDGEMVEKLLTGPGVFMRTMQGSIEEAFKMLGALTAALRLGDPLIDKAVEETILKEKKSLLNRTGAKSSTASQVSTDTPQSSSAS